ncbi:serine/arginine-rich splicing factor 11 isoform X2 [Hydra vulgaris]|uniref:Serine/arginine-rich splicing factor 11 isoform X2 n=2 Tax=Hydra vulgaris TaxID=6087 RepID=A0ABM4B7T8_HYDVU
MLPDFDVVELMVRSGSSERGKKNKKSSKHRSRSRSISSGRTRRSRHSRSKERQRYLSNSSDRSRSHSSSSERNKQSYYSRSRDKKQQRSHSRERYKSSSQDRRRRSTSKERNNKRNRSIVESSRCLSSDDSLSNVKSSENTVSLKDKIKELTVRSERKNEQIIPTYEQIMKIENDSFVQEKFSSTNSTIPQQTTKKKKKKKQKNLAPIVQNLDQPKLPAISHENAIFGSTIETMHVSRFNSKLVGEKKEFLKNIENDDLIFGAMFCEKPEVRMIRWVEKLTCLRKIFSENETNS